MSTVEWHKDQDGEGVIFITLEQDAFKCAVVFDDDDDDDDDDDVAPLQNAASTHTRASERASERESSVCPRYVVSSLPTKKVPLFSSSSSFI